MAIRPPLPRLLSRPPPPWPAPTYYLRRPATTGSGGIRLRRPHGSQPPPDPRRSYLYLPLMAAFHLTAPPRPPSTSPTPGDPLPHCGEPPPDPVHLPPADSTPPPPHPTQLLCPSAGLASLPTSATLARTTSACRRPIKRRRWIPLDHDSRIPSLPRPQQSGLSPPSPLLYMLDMKESPASERK